MTMNSSVRQRNLAGGKETELSERQRRRIQCAYETVSGGTPSRLSLTSQRGTRRRSSEYAWREASLATRPTLSLGNGVALHALPAPRNELVPHSEGRSTPSTLRSTASPGCHEAGEEDPWAELPPRKRQMAMLLDAQMREEYETLLATDPPSEHGEFWSRTPGAGEKGYVATWARKGWWGRRRKWQGVTRVSLKVSEWRIEAGSRWT